MINLDSKGQAYMILLVVVAVSIAFWYYSDSYSDWSMHANPWLAMVANLVLNPAYIFLIAYLFSKYSWRGLISGLFISIAVDIASLSHSIRMDAMMPNDAAAYSYADTLLFKIFPSQFHNWFGVFLLYVLVPVLLVYLSFRIIRRTASFNKIFKESL